MKKFLTMFSYTVQLGVIGGIVVALTLFTDRYSFRLHELKHTGFFLLYMGGIGVVVGVAFFAVGALAYGSWRAVIILLRQSAGYGRSPRSIRLHQIASNIENFFKE